MSLSRRDFLLRGALAGASFATAMTALGRGARLLAQGIPDPPRPPSERAVALVLGATTIDMLGLLTLDWPELWGWQEHPASFGAADAARLRSSGIAVFHPAIEPGGAQPFAASLACIEDWNRLLAAHPELFVRVTTPADLDRPRAEGKIGVILGFQDSRHFRTAGDVERFYGLGQRVSQLTYDGPNRLGCGCRHADDGLTSFGAEIVAAMNRLGMAVDLSHCGERTTLDACAVSRAPVLVTHANCRALSQHPRCKSDQAIRAVAASGGVFGITQVRAFVGAPATLDHLLDHFDHVASLVGAEHVGLGSDADAIPVNAATGAPRAPYELRRARSAVPALRRRRRPARPWLERGRRPRRARWQLPPRARGDLGGRRPCRRGPRPRLCQSGAGSNRLVAPSARWCRTGRCIGAQGGCSVSLQLLVEHESSMASHGPRQGLVPSLRPGRDGLAGHRL